MSATKHPSFVFAVVVVADVLMTMTPANACPGIAAVVVVVVVVNDGVHLHRHVVHAVIASFRWSWS